MLVSNSREVRSKSGDGNQQLSNAEKQEAIHGILYDRTSILQLNHDDYYADIKNDRPYYAEIRNDRKNTEKEIIFLKDRVSIHGDKTR